MVAAGQSRTVDRAAGHRGQRQERRGVGQVRLDEVVDRLHDAGRDRPAVRLGVVDLDAVLAQHRHGHVDVGERGHRLAVVADVDALVVARAGQQQRRDELRGRRRVDDHAAAAHRAGAADRRTAGPRGPRPRRRRRACAARPAPRRSGGSACAGRRRRRRCRWTARRPAARTASPSRPARSRPAASRSNGPASPPSPSPEVSTVEPRPVSAVAIRRVSLDRSARRTTEGPSASEASSSARLVSDLLPGSETTASTGPVARGRGPASPKLR